MELNFPYSYCEKDNIPSENSTSDEIDVLSVDNMNFDAIQTVNSEVIERDVNCRRSTLTREMKKKAKVAQRKKGQNQSKLISIGAGDSVQSDAFTLPEWEN